MGSSSHFVPFDGEHKDVADISERKAKLPTSVDADEQLLTSFTTKVTPVLPVVKEETNNLAADDSHILSTHHKSNAIEKEENGANNDNLSSAQKDITTTKTSNKPSPAMKTIANFLEVDPMSSPSVHDNSDISNMPPPQTPPREALNKKVLNEDTMFQVN